MDDSTGSSGRNLPSTTGTDREPIGAIGGSSSPAADHGPPLSAGDPTPTGDGQPGDYPPAPWDLSGQLWGGLFRLHAGRVPIPVEARRLLPGRTMLLLFVRYLEGILRYDELVFGTLVSLKGKRGLWIDRIWVDSEASLWGGRRLWGLPKQLARFDWQGDTVTVTDEGGSIVTLTVDRRPAHLPELPIPIPGLGRIDGRYISFTGELRARIGRGGLRLEAWTDRFGYRPSMRPLLNAATKPFHFHLDAGQPLE